MSFQEDKLTEIADAIRSKEGSSEPIVASEFAERIEALSTGGTSGVRSFNGRTGAVVPGVDDYTAEMVGALSEDGGTLYGDLHIKPSGTYGGHLNFGDGDYVEISEPEDDCLQIKAQKINFVVSDETNQKFTLNGEPIGTAGPAGADGKSAYQYAVDGGYTGTEAEFQSLMANANNLNGGPFLPLSGGTMGGKITIPYDFEINAPKFRSSSSNKLYPVTNFLAPGIMYSGSSSYYEYTPRIRFETYAEGAEPGFELGSNSVLRGVLAPIFDNDAANKHYVDDLVGDIATLLDSINGEVA